MAWVYVSFLFAGILLLLLVVLTFKHGYRATHLDRMPLGRIALYTFGIALFGAALDWARADPDTDLWAELGAAGLIFLAASLLWLAGFFLGRWLAAKHLGVIREP